jgi:hypothetical protein
MVRRTLCLFFLILIPFLAFSQDNSNRILNFLDDVLSAAVEAGKEASATASSPQLSEGPSFFYILNNTGFTVRGIYVCQADTENWGSNLFNGYLYNGQSTMVPLKQPLAEENHYNIRLVDADGDRYSRYNVELTEHGTVRISISDFDFEK